MQLTLEQQYMLSVRLSYAGSIMHADQVATLGASASAGMVLTPKRRNISYTASED